MNMLRNLLLAGLVWALTLAAQTKSVIGAIQSIDTAKGTLTVKNDQGDTFEVTFAPEVSVKRIQPGAKDLASAEVVPLTGLATGDRVLARGALTEKTLAAASLIVITARDIKKRDDAERMEWTRRGIFGLVQSVDKDKRQVKVTVRSMAGAQEVTVDTTEATNFKRYAPDSVKFSDAKDANLGEIKKGDQLRALGEKAADNLSIKAERVVFGTFRVAAGTITAVDAEAGEIKFKDLSSGKTLTVKTTADSQLKRMPNFGAMMGGGGMGGGMGMGMGGGRPPGAGGGPPGGTPGAKPPGGGGAPDMSVMLDRMPATKLADLKAGETIVVSSTLGAKADLLTAIILLANADMLIQMAQRQAGGAGGPGGAGGMGGGGGGFEGALGGMMGGMGGGMGGMGGGMGPGN